MSRIAGLLASRGMALGASTVLGAVAFGAYGSKVRNEPRVAPHLPSPEELKSRFSEGHGHDNATAFDLSELAALGEDGNVQGRVGEWRCWGIFDGHSGWCTSNHVATHILNYVNAAYNKKLSSGLLGWVSPKAESALSDMDVDDAIASGFTNLDADIVQQPLQALKRGDIELAAQSLPIALNGSCAMLALYSPIRHVLKVALVGDSRAVLGVQDSSGLWHARNLTVDQTGDNPNEAARIRSEHPLDPPEIVSNGRVLGWEPSRVFGDSVLKWTRSEQAALRTAFYLRPTPSLVRTPPYMTAKPVISTTNINPQRPSFLVLGCDGLYEWLSNEQVVSLVADWLDKNPVIPHQPSTGVADHSDASQSPKTAFRPRRLGWGPLKPTIEDSNAATHLIRNALGGAEATKVSLLVSIPAPMARRHRDDITCTVVFFGPSQEPRPKL